MPGAERAMSVSSEGGIQVVKLRGSFDFTDGQALHRFLTLGIDPLMPTILDMTGAQFIDSTVIGELIMLGERLAARGFAIAVDPLSPAGRVCTEIQLGQVVTVRRNLAEARRAIHPAT